MDNAERQLSMNNADENRIKQYLLGALSETDREQLENTLLVSDEGLESIELIEEELINDYLSGELNETERQQFETIFLCTANRKSKLEYLRTLRKIAAQTQAEPELAPNVISFPQQPKQFSTRMFSRQWLQLAASLLLTLGIGFVVWKFLPGTDQNLIALNRAYATQRPLEARIAGFNYAPFAQTRGTNETEASVRILRERAERILLDAIAEKPTAANKHALGKFYLAEKKFDQALEQFKAALVELPKNATLENDLGATFFELSKQEAFKNQGGESMRHLAEGFEHVSRALELQPDYAEALFNRALCKEKLLLNAQAIEDWKLYLQLDAKSLWADEARRHIEELQKTGRLIYDPEKWYTNFLAASAARDDNRAYQFLTESYQVTGNVIIERLIDEYLAAKESRDEAKSVQCLQLLDYAGRLTLARANDPYFAELAKYYRQSSPAQRLQLRDARQQIQDTIKLSRKGEKKKAVEKYLVLQKLFQQLDDHCESAFVSYLRGVALLRLNQVIECEAIFTPMSQPSNRFKWLRGQALYVLSDGYDRQGMLSDSVQTTQISLEIADQLQDTNFKFRSLNQLAIYSYLVGDWQPSLTYLAQARAIATTGATAEIEIWGIVTMNALVCSDLQFLYTAIALQKEAVQIAKELHRDLQLSLSYTYLGTILGLQGNYSNAIEFTRRGYDIGVRSSKYLSKINLVF